jgi:pimeloyl-ACP methyl ester carboxylesterase
MNAPSLKSLIAAAALTVLVTGWQTPAAAGPHAVTDSSSPHTEKVIMKINETGEGRNILVLHGGGGPMTMGGLAAHLAAHAHVITPTHPGWDGSPRPESLKTVAELADEYVRFLGERDLKDVILVGSSLGGWLAAEIALRDKGHHVTGLVIINGLGVNVPGHPITNVTGFSPAELAKVAYHDPSKFGAGAPPMTPERLAMMRANAATLAVFAGDPYSYDPTLLGRLKGIHVPTLVLWGASDHVVTKEYGSELAKAIPHAKFETVADAGHLPWLEQPVETFRLLDGFVAAHSPVTK